MEFTPRGREMGEGEMSNGGQLYGDRLKADAIMYADIEL